MLIVFFVVGLVYGATLNFILSGEDASVFWAYVKGILVGFFAGTIYLFLTFLFGHCFNQEYLENKLIKIVIMLTNVTAFVGMCYGITILIGNNEPITLEYAWMHIVNWMFVGGVVGKSNYDGKVLRNYITEREKYDK